MVCKIFLQFKLFVLTINVRLFKKLRDIIFFCGTITWWAISRDILRGPRIFWPLILSQAQRGTMRLGQFRGQKSRGPLNMSQEIAHKVIVPKKNYVPKFLKQRAVDKVFQKSGTKSVEGYDVLFVPLFCCPREKCGRLWKTTSLHNVDNIRQKDITFIFFQFCVS